jgi:pimeloyl-ACP methyl ester carboxylesterase
LADRLVLERFICVGCSTGGAYALALAALEPDRVESCVACCALTDMRWPEGRAMMTGPGAMGTLIAGIWDAPDRAAALERTTEILGVDGSGLLTQTPDTPFPPADLAFLSDPAVLIGYAEAFAAMFGFGVQGFTDDRLADGVGWKSFDVGRVECPTVVLHGAADPLVPLAQAEYTAGIVPGSTLRVLPDLGHLSISTQVVPLLREIHGE